MQNKTLFSNNHLSRKS